MLFPTLGQWEDKGLLSIECTPEQSTVPQAHMVDKDEVFVTRYCNNRGIQGLKMTGRIVAQQANKAGPE
jgi:hypothetical protein